MINEYPPQSTLMNQPSINGNIVASDVYDYYINNELNKAIDEYWQSKYKTFAKGRIKRMRTNKDKGLGYWKYRTNRHILRYKLYDLICAEIKITRWNKH